MLSTFSSTGPPFFMKNSFVFLLSSNKSLNNTTTTTMDVRPIMPAGTIDKSVVHLCACSSFGITFRSKFALTVISPYRILANPIAPVLIS
ncbi:Os10g0175700 [Oryza sativa Japonica Group]|uniref:Os10g0175700 protein n=1 Tax=Oryza sativa subsp. japonica TaxID=39947 RepID=A0A0P0XSY1_ORYSJ|nr:hypothetical protein EE612_050322 [Oryza sativa]BAT10091.1 Os10g0175700 [Oryza sativa Japonica Group]